MSLVERPPAPGRTNFRHHAERLNDFLVRTKSKLAYYVAGDTPTEDGIVLYDRAGYPVISKDNEWRQIVLADGYAEVSRTTSQTATAANTVQNISFDTISGAGGITIDAIDATKIVFAEGGLYQLNGHLQLRSSSASAKTFYYWFALDGVDSAHSERETVHQNISSHTVGVNDLVSIPEGSHIQIRWAVDDTDLWLDAAAATAFAPQANAANIYITRIQQ